MFWGCCRQDGTETGALEVKSVTSASLSAQGRGAGGWLTAQACPLLSCPRLVPGGVPSVIPSSISEGLTLEQQSVPTSKSPELVGELQEGEASPAHIQLQGGLGVGGHDPGGHAEGHRVCEEGHLFRQGLGVGNEDSVGPTGSPIRPQAPAPPPPACSVPEPPNWPPTFSPYPSPQCHTYPHVHQADAERDQPQEISVGEGEPLHVESDLLLPWLPLYFVG